MNTISIRSALRTGWYTFSRRPWYLLGVTLAFTVICMLTVGNAAFTALAYIAFGGYLAMLLAFYRGQPIVFDDMFSLDQRWISFAFLGVIKTALIFLGLIAFLVPGIYLAVRWIFAEFLVIDKGMRPLEALRESSKMTAGVRGKLFLFTIVSIVLILLGLVALIIGAFVASVVVTFALIAMYEARQDRGQPILGADRSDQEVTVG
jgi:uncharacterized membrane protein